MSRKILVLPGDGIGPEIVAEALKEIQETRTEVSTLLGLAPEYAAQNPALEQQWKAVTDQLNEVIGAGKGDSSAGAFRVDANDDNTPDNAAGARNPGKDEIIEDIDDTSDALSSADGFAAATAQGGKGVFKEAEPSADDAARGAVADRQTIHVGHWTMLYSRSVTSDLDL